MNQPQFTVPLNATILVDIMKGASPGDVFTYENLSRAIGGEDPRKVWLSARRILRQDHDLVFDCVRTKGYQCLSAGQVLDKGAGMHRRIQRMVRARGHELRTVKPDQLGPEDRRKYHGEVALAGLIGASVTADIRRQALEGKPLTISRGFSAGDLASRFGAKDAQPTAG